MKGPNPEPHTPWLDLEQPLPPPYKAPALQGSTCRERGLTNIQMLSNIHLHHVGVSEFSLQMKIQCVGCFFEMNALYMYFCIQSAPSFTDMFEMLSQCVVFWPFSLLLSVSGVCKIRQEYLVML